MGHKNRFKIGYFLLLWLLFTIVYKFIFLFYCLFIGLIMLARPEVVRGFVNGTSKINKDTSVCITYLFVVVVVFAAVLP